MAQQAGSAAKVCPFKRIRQNREKQAALQSAVTSPGAGFGSGCMILTFAFAKESVPAHLSGTVSGAMNMGVMMGTMLLQPAVGWVLDHLWDGRMVEGVRSGPGFR